MKDLKVLATPKAEGMFQFQGLDNVEFEFPVLVRTVLFIHCGVVRGSARGGKDFDEIVGRLYESDNPQGSGENHVGKLYIWVHTNTDGVRFETKCERFEWHPDGSFDVINPDGSRASYTRPSGG